MEKGLKKDVFRTNPEKAASRITINSFMMGSVFMIFVLIWTLSPEKFSWIIITQLVLSIPLLFVSSLAYAKIGYWKETRLWDAFGWFTNNTANIFILNVIGLLAAILSSNLAIAYFILTLLLMLLYSAINVVYKQTSLKEKIWKFLFFATLTILLGLIPSIH